MPGSPTRRRSSASSPHCGTPSGSSIARRRSRDPSKSCAIFPVTPTVSPSRTAASLQPTTPASRSAGKTIASTGRAAGRRCGFTRTSSSGAFSCTCCPGASTASATTGSSPTPTAPRTSQQPAHCSAPTRLPPRQLRRLLAHVGLEIVDKGLAFGAPNLEPLLGAPAVDRPLDRKQRVDAADHLDGDRRERNLLLSDSLAARVLLDVAGAGR